MSDQQDESLSKTELADKAEHGDDVPSKMCEGRGVGHKPCPNEAVEVVFARSDSRVNEHGVHIETEVRILFVCEEHTHLGSSIPDWEASVKRKSGPTETTTDE
jgi:hypothetical protein